MLKLAFLLSLLVANPARAEIASLFGQNPRTMGMGAVSLVQGETSPYQVYSAPAALGFIRRVEVGVGALYMDPRIRPFGSVRVSSSGTLGDFKSSGVLPGGGTLAAIALPLGRERPLVFGGSVFLPFSTLIRVSGNPVNYPFYPLYTDISRNFFFVLGAGYEIIDGLSLGINLRSETKSSTFYTLNKDNNVSYSATATEAKSESKMSFSAVYDHGKKNPETRWSVGAMYRAPAGLQTKIAADVTAFVPIQGEIVNLPAYTPAEWVVMGSGSLSDPLTVSGDLAWVRWSKYSPPYGSGNINTYTFSAGNAARFKDIPVARIGADYSRPTEGGWIKRVGYRLGYMYHPSPVPDQTEDTNFADNDRHLFSLGFGMSVPSLIRDGELLGIDLFAQYNLLQERKVTKSAATRIGAPGYTTGGKILLYGLGATMKF